LLLLVALLLPASAGWSAPVATPDGDIDRAVAMLSEARRAHSPAAAQQLGRAALALLDDTLAADPPPHARRRATFDRIVALSRLGMADETLGAFVEAEQQYAPLPAYVLGAAGDAHALRRDVEDALMRYEQALALDPDDDAVHAGRIFALADLDRMDEAAGILEQRLAERPNRDDRLRLAMIHAWSGQVARGRADVDELAAAAPDDAELARQQGSLVLIADRPFAALTAYDRALASEPGYVAAALDRVRALDALGRFDEADAVVDSLDAEASDWPPFQRLREQRRRDRGALLESLLRAGRGDDRELAAGEIRSETTLWSPRLRNGLRVYGAHRRAYADFRGQALEDQRWVVGLQLQRGTLRLRVEADEPVDRHVDQRGTRVAADWRAGDSWSFGAEYARNAFDLPLRARAVGTTGNRWAAAARHAWNDQHSARLSIGGVDYDDDNRNSWLGLSSTSRFALSDRLLLELTPAVYGSRNSTDEVPYYSPLRDHSVELGARLEHRIQARVSRRHLQHVEAWGGRYHQRYHAAQQIGGLRWGYRFEIAQARWVTARIGRDRRAYDGVPEYQTFVELGLQVSW
jgi:biofilm PGA synthesis protein PgaA